MYTKWIEPGIFPLVFFIAFTVVREYGRRHNWPRWRKADLLRLFALVIAARDYLVAWHVEIAAGWIRHPELSIFCFIMFVPIVEVLILNSIFGKGGFQAMLTDQRSQV